MKKLLFVFNPYSGKGQIKNNLMDIINIFTKAGYRVTAYPTQAPNDGFEKIKNEAYEYDRVVVSGGDGTLNEAVHGMLEVPEDKRVPIGYIPTGTVNDFSISLGIPKGMIDAAKIAVADSLFKCDICQFNNRPYNYVAAFGAFTEVPYETPQETKNIFGQMAYIFEGIKKMPTIQKYHAVVRFEDTVVEDDFILGMILNSKSVAGFELKDDRGIINDISLNDGMFEGILVRMPTTLVDFQSIISDFFVGNFKGSAFVSFKTSHVEFEFGNPVKWTLDGEFGGSCKNAEINLLNEAVTFVVSEEI